jgi:hypothetical protein
MGSMVWRRWLLWGVITGACAMVLLFKLCTAPDVEMIERVPSPDNRWIALVYTEGYISFSPSFDAVVIRHSGWLGWLLQAKVFEIEDGDTTSPKVRWDGNAHLFISPNNENQDVPVRMREFRGIRIDYD